MDVFLVDRFFQEDCDAHTRRVLLAAISSVACGAAYFTFDIFNVLIDHDRNVVTVEDELEAGLQQSVPLPLFRERLMQQ